jgi:hypothetical protein
MPHQTPDARPDERRESGFQAFGRRLENIERELEQMADLMETLADAVETLADAVEAGRIRCVEIEP